MECVLFFDGKLEFWDDCARKRAVLPCNLQNMRCIFVVFNSDVEDEAFVIVDPSHELGYLVEGYIFLDCKVSVIARFAVCEFNKSSCVINCFPVICLLPSVQVVARIKTCRMYLEQEFWELSVPKLGTEQRRGFYTLCTGCKEWIIDLITGVGPGIDGIEIVGAWCNCRPH